MFKPSPTLYQIYWLTVIVLLVFGCTSRSPSIRVETRQPERPATARDSFAASDFLHQPWYPTTIEEAAARLYPEPVDQPFPIPDPAAMTTFAVIAIEHNYTEKQELLERAVRGILAFQPQTMLVLGKLGQTRSAEARQNLRMIIAEETGRPPLIMMPDPEKSFELKPWPSRGSWLFFNPDAVERATDLDLLTALDEIEEQLRQAPPGPVILATTPDYLETIKTRGWWRRLCKVLEPTDSRVKILIGGAGQFSWWQEEQFDFFTIPGLTRAWDQRSDLAAGRFNGLLWGAAGPDAQLSLLAVDLSAVLQHREMARDDQRIVEILNANLTATPFSDQHPLTTVTLRNTTEHKLDFGARWTANGQLAVDPAVVAFTLHPNQVFSQQFRLQSPSSSRLKFLAPQFLLQTEIPGPAGIPRKIELKTAPWGRLATIAPFRSEPVTINGSLEDWSQPEIQINHSSQLIAGREHWRGPADLSGRVYLAHDHDFLYMAVQVVDDQAELPEGTFATRSKLSIYLQIHELVQDRPPSTGNNQLPIDQAQAAVLTLTTGPSREMEIESNPPGLIPAGIESAVVTVENGYVVELVLPKPGFVKDGEPHKQVLMDVLIQSDEPDGTNGYREKIMQFSGHGPSPGLFAVIRLQPPPLEEQPAE